MLVFADCRDLGNTYIQLKLEREEPIQFFRSLGLFLLLIRCHFPIHPFFELGGANLSRNQNIPGDALSLIWR
jgi:hypothetical protein